MKMDSTYKDQNQQVSALACHQRRDRLAEEDHHLRCPLGDLFHRLPRPNRGLLRLLHPSYPRLEEYCGH